MTWLKVLQLTNGLSFNSRKVAEERETVARKLAAEFIRHFQHLAQHGETAAIRELAAEQLADYFTVLSDAEQLN
jgi:hypothetical protein